MKRLREAIHEAKEFNRFVASFYDVLEEAKRGSEGQTMIIY